MSKNPSAKYNAAAIEQLRKGLWQVVNEFYEKDTHPSDEKADLALLDVMSDFFLDVLSDAARHEASNPLKMLEGRIEQLRSILMDRMVDSYEDARIRGKEFHTCRECGSYHDPQRPHRGSIKSPT